MKIITKIHDHFISDSLFKNSIYLMLSTAIMAFFGFLFWIINARLFTTEEVGLGTTLISVLTLISNFSLLGLNNGLIRYLPKSERRPLKINTSLTLVALVAILAAVTFLIVLPFVSPKLVFLRSNVLYFFFFIFYCVFAALFLLIESVFVAYRETIYVLIKNTIFSLVKLILPFLLIAAGAFGLFSASALAMVVAFSISFILLARRFNFVFRPTLNTDVLRNMARFSAGSYTATFLSTLPALVLPVIITNKIGPHESAYFYIDMMIANFLYIIPMTGTP